MNKSYFHHLGVSLLLIFKVDKIRIPAWILTTVLIIVATAASFSSLFQSEEERQIMAESMKNPAVTAIVGFSSGLEGYSDGAMLSHQMLLITAFIIGLISILFVAKHTRADEEEGRLELFRSLPVGRLTNVTSTLLAAFIQNILLAILMTLGLMSLQIESIDWQGSVLFGSVLAGTGLFFSTLTAVLAQLNENSRGTISFSFMILGLSYLVRAVGDVSDGSWSMLSPLGWVVHAEVFVINNWNPVWLLFGFSMIFSILSIILNLKRDLGSSLIAAKQGKATASTFITSSWGFVLRLQRTQLLVWLLVMYVMGASYGALFGELEFFFSSDVMQQMLASQQEADMMSSFVSLIMSLNAMVATIPAILILMRLQKEERGGRSEHLLIRTVSRNKWLGIHFILSLVSSFIFLIVSKIGVWSIAILVMNDTLSFSHIWEATVVFVPAIWIFVGLAVLLFGYRPQLMNAIWVLLGYSFFIIYFEGFFQFPTWMEKLTPFSYIPQLPLEELKLGSLIVLTAISSLFIILGFINYNRRDLIG
ncbi:ABC transporter permease [Alkalihalobacillus trypoxylicola]|uniref:ABC transporter permease n=1 Tax=Alkalihalobacillus trypoxylicola TaxID=519424 RepID=A0A162F081_9BACI|nr:ABC-2 transporter permease [Alkalihalobacillus trypoxylicola]KYG34152.1 ABC transporter permease [Alkalihalobacillus trypoxylicola]